MIEGVEEEEDEGIKELEGIVQDECNEMSEIDEFGLLLNALTENDTYNTIRINVNCRGRDLTVLIDSESTYNFIGESTITKLNVATSKTTLFAVIMANGNVMLCEMHSPGFTWFMQSYEFKANLRVLKLSRHDIVLGVNWLKKYSLVLFDFIKLQLLFKKEGRMIELKEISQVSDLQMMTTIKEQRSFKDVSIGLVGQFFTMDIEEEGHPTEAVMEIKALRKFAGLFEEPRTLPPHKEV
jgi:hypothetical protein